MSTKIGSHSMIDASMLKHIRHIYLLLRQIGMQEQKESLVYSFTHGRTVHVSEMNEQEAKELIAYLTSYSEQPNGKAERANTMRRKIISQAHRMGWQLGDGGRGAKVDMERLNAWCLKSSYLGKELNAYTYEQLPKLVTQFNEVYKSFLKRVV